ncbi:MAG: TRAP transporter substrate-binding protein [Planctomycetes bacterium]|nr:TRAP transporter substrate-binding protein [Planctomycetota bacterium]
MTRRSRGAKKSEIRNPKSETSSNIQISRHAIATGAKQSPGTRSENVYEKWHGHPARGVSWHRHPADDPGAGSPCHVEPALHTPSEIALSLRFSQGHERGFRAASAFWSLGFWSFEFVSDFGFRIWDFCAARLQISRLRSYPAWARPAVILKLGHGLDVSHPVHKGMVFMAEKVHEKSGGRMRVEIFPNEQLGNEKECIEALQLGYLAMTKTSSAPMEGFVPQMRVFGIPYLFRDAEHFWKVCNGPSGKKLLLAGESKRLRGLCYYDAGARSFYAKRPIEKPADLTGLKIRVQNSIMSIKMVQAMGGSPTPIPWGELYTALDQGVVDGAENNAPSFRTSRHYEVCGYYSLDEHTRLPDVLVISTRVWNHLTPEQQRILQEAVDESVAYQRQLWAEAEEADLKTVQEAGAKIVRPDLAPFRASVQTVWKEFEGTEIGDLIRQIQEVQ